MNFSKIQQVCLAGVLFMGLVSGCQTGKYVKPPDDAAPAATSIVLSEGDVVKIAFPSAPNLDTTAQIRRDGKITVPVLGEVQAAGMTASDLEKSLKKAYEGQLVSNDISVMITSSMFSVYVTGAVGHPGKINSDKPITALDAIMEAGGPDYTRANLKAVLIDRKVNGLMEHYKVDLDAVLKGRSNKNFSLHPGDIIYVPEKFSWF